MVSGYALRANPYMDSSRFASAYMDSSRFASANAG